MKLTHIAVNYGRGTPVRNCGLCRKYQGHSCAIVANPISPFGDCNHHVFPKNPWGPALTKDEIAAINQMMEK